MWNCQNICELTYDITRALEIESSPDREELQREEMWRVIVLIFDIGPNNRFHNKGLSCSTKKWKCKICNANKHVKTARFY